MFRTLLAIAVLPPVSVAQNASFPLETVSLTGTAFPKDLVMQLSGLRTGMPLNKAAIEEACGKLEATGLFQSVNYHYGPAQKGGYALTLTLADDREMWNAVIDVPGVDEDEVWRWLSAKYPPFDRKVPRSDAGEQIVMRAIEQHLGPKLDGQRLTARVEQNDLTSGAKATVVLEPEILPRVASMSFTGNAVVPTPELLAAMDRIVAEQEYTDRRYRRYVDLNLRRVYEQHGLYRVRFLSVTAQKAADHMVNVSVSIEEGPQYTLGDVHLTGSSLPEAEMLKAANFKIGQPANWTEIQNDIWAMEKPIKRSGYFEAKTVPGRVFDDQRHVLNLNVTVNKGPLYTFGVLATTGLSPDLDAKARRLWRAHPGDPYDFEYPQDFFREFARVVDFRQFRKYQVITSKKSGNVMDITLEFEPR